jgi:hypothetical protein
MTDPDIVLDRLRSLPDSIPTPADVQWIIDVNPVDMM